MFVINELKKQKHVLLIQPWVDCEIKACMHGMNVRSANE